MGGSDIDEAEGQGRGAMNRPEAAERLVWAVETLGGEAGARLLRVGRWAGGGARVGGGANRGRRPRRPAPGGRLRARGGGFAGLPEARRWRHRRHRPVTE